jgi:hypothetical protein
MLAVDLHLARDLPQISRSIRLLMRVTGHRHCGLKKRGESPRLDNALHPLSFQFGGTNGRKID